MNNLFSTDRRMLVYGLNKSYADIFCFSTTRHGGYSGGKYSSFNCNHYCGDRQEDVERNRKLLTDIMILYLVKCRIWLFPIRYMELKSGLSMSHSLLLPTLGAGNSLKV